MQPKWYEDAVLKLDQALGKGIITKLEYDTEIRILDWELGDWEFAEFNTKGKDDASDPEILGE